MIGVVVISHGDMAKGMLNSASMFFGELEQVVACGLYPADSPEEFDAKLTEAIASVDTGDGVYVLCDLVGGTPCNRAAYKCSPKVHVIGGMNLAMLMELLGMRMSGAVDADAVTSAGANGIANYNKLLGIQ